MKWDWFPAVFPNGNAFLGKEFLCSARQLLQFIVHRQEKGGDKRASKTRAPSSDAENQIYVTQKLIQWYERLSWLAGCRDCKEGEHVLYCFPCALFSGEHTGCWSKSGYTNLANFGRDSRKHGNSARHVACEASLAEFGKGNIESSMTYATAF